MRFWISWHQPTEDHRPLTYPPNTSVLGWWCSGSDEKDRWTLCALVRAGTEADAQAAVLTDWPEAEDWRFCNEVGTNFQPGDRFPLSEWMKTRIEAAR
jgi:hypothetical protein